jgi:hypothetical protein
MNKRMPLLAVLIGIVATALLGIAWWLYSGGPVRPVVREFSADGVSKLIVRAALVDAATVITDPQATMIEVCGVPTGGAKGYHSSNPFWRETPAQQWGLDFVNAHHGNVLVVSSVNEIRFIHHAYVLTDLSIRVPPNVEVIRQTRKRTGDGEPDLSPP